MHIDAHKAPKTTLDNKIIDDMKQVIREHTERKIVLEQRYADGVMGEEHLNYFKAESDNVIAYCSRILELITKEKQK